jgi:hypothetical protein
LSCPPSLSLTYVPRYYFQVKDGTQVRDDDGTELPDLHAARVEAARLAGALLRDRAWKFWDGRPWHIEGANGPEGVGRLLSRLSFSAADGPK